MKLSFTTLGCPDWSLDTIVSKAAEFGYDAIDFRGLNGEMNIYKLPEFSDRLDETKALIAGAGLSVSCFSSSVSAFSKDKFDSNLEEIKQYVKLCSLFGASFIRVFGGKIGSTDRSEAVKTTAGHLQEMAKVASDSGVKVLLETHDDWIDCRHMRAVLEQTDSAAVGALWDLHHPYRMIGEQPATTLQELGPWIHYTHIKDSVPKAGDEKHPFQYVLTGEGDIPLQSMVTLLQQSGYQGYFTLEWEKKWHPEIPEAQIAFPQYVQYMRGL